ncbi:hypothetical protein GGP41_003329, partial [Bipolaris sorokiniana]
GPSNETNCTFLNPYVDSSILFRGATGAASSHAFSSYLDSSMSKYKYKEDITNMPSSNHSHTPVSHTLTRSNIQSWKDSIRQARQNCAFVEKWPCMYCQNSIDLNSLRDHTRFRCRNSECVGVGKLQVTCFWDVRGS